MRAVQTTRRLDMPDAFRDTSASGTRTGERMTVPCGRHLRTLADRLIGGSSLVSTEPVLDMRDFDWTATLRANWEAIRDEARAVAGQHGWQSSTHSHGYPIRENAARCPRTAALIQRIPGLGSACFSILAPGAHVPAHRGETKGLITCHLGLVVPRSGDVRMRVHDRVVRWAEGETLVFDDTYAHEVWNDTCGARVVLAIRFARPLRQPARWFADLLRVSRS